MKLELKFFSKLLTSVRPLKYSQAILFLLFKTSENCYTQKLLSEHSKNPQPRHSMITFKRVKEMFPHMEQVEYKIGVAE